MEKVVYVCIVLMYCSRVRVFVSLTFYCDNFELMLHVCYESLNVIVVELELAQPFPRVKCFACLKLFNSELMLLNILIFTGINKKE